MGLKLRKINLGPIWNASGALGWFGEGYRYHRLFKPLGLTFGGSTFTAKSVTFEPHKGNMELNPEDWTPLRLLPDCIIVKPFHGVVLNAVGLSCPGAARLLGEMSWQRRTEPFWLSFAAVSKTSAAERIGELRGFTTMLADQLKRNLHRNRVGLQVNLSCPNVALVHDQSFEFEARSYLDTVGELGIPIVVKIAATLSFETAAKVAGHPACDGLCVSNTIPWGELPDLIDWKGIFGTDVSPLKAKYGVGGGLSGKPLLPIVAKWVRLANEHGITKPINAGGGILQPQDVVTLKEAGAHSVSIGSIAMLRPWHMRRVIEVAYEQFR